MLSLGVRGLLREDPLAASLNHPGGLRGTLNSLISGSPSVSSSNARFKGVLGLTTDRLRGVGGSGGKGAMRGGGLDALVLAVRGFCDAFWAAEAALLAADRVWRIGAGESLEMQMTEGESEMEICVASVELEIVATSWSGRGGALFFLAFSAGAGLAGGSFGLNPGLD